jgi:lipopolysaccharide/colanic/teichoic acid biosynthesis glycosyltransferase
MVRDIIKRLVDILITVVAIVVLVPVFGIIYILIKTSSNGPALFKQKRAGRGGEPFTMLKFRTMKIDVEPFGQSPESGADPRLIRSGKFLREYSLDELPQLFNVLRGEMSLVGPRPLYISQIAELSDHHKKRLFVRPGLTGASQVHGRSLLTDPAMLEVEVEYADKQNLWLDMKIVFQTVWVVLCKKGVYEDGGAAGNEG